MRAVCHTNSPTLDVIDFAFKSLLTHSIEEAIFSAHALNFCAAGSVTHLNIHNQRLRVAKEPIFPKPRIAPVIAP